MIPNILRNRRLIELLQRIDREIATRARAEGCPQCGGVLHSAPYLRSPRGLPDALASMKFYRESLCCARDGCRARVAPPSVLFYGRRHYLAVSHLLLRVLDRKPNSRRRLRLKQRFGVDRRTLDRWRRWWQESFRQTALYRSTPVLAIASPLTPMPQRLFETFAARGWKRLIDVLSFLAPVAAPSIELTRAQRWVAATRRVCPGRAR
jgi:hypothetical protein